MFITKRDLRSSRDIKREAKAQLSGRWQSILLLVIIPVLITSSILLFTSNTQVLETGEVITTQNNFFNTGGGGLIRDILSYFLITGVLFTMLDMISLRDYRISPIEDLVQIFKKYKFIHFIILYILKRIYTFLWSLLFIIPGIIKTFSYSQAELITKDYNDNGKTISANEAITLSRELMNGHKMDLFMLYLSFFGWYLLSAVTLWIPMLYVLPYLQASKAVFYRNITKEYMENNTDPIDDSYQTF